MKTMIAALMLLLLTGCGAVIRNADTYEAQVEWFKNAGVKLANQRLDQARIERDKGHIDACMAIAEDALSVRLLFPFRAVMMLNLADMAEHPGKHPVPPPADQWCIEGGE